MVALRLYKLLEVNFFLWRKTYFDFLGRLERLLQWYHDNLEKKQQSKVNIKSALITNVCSAG
jgi:hypothetical protein